MTNKLYKGFKVTISKNREAREGHKISSPPLKNLSPGWHPNDPMRTLGHQWLPMNGKDNNHSYPTIEDKKPHIKSSYPQAKAPPSKSKLTGTGAKNGVVQKYVGEAARRKALGF